MKYQDEKHKKLSEEEMIDIESSIFNEVYNDRAILGRDGLKFSLEEFWNVNRRLYKKGAYERGYRKRRLFDLMDVSSINEKRILDVGCGRGVESVVCAKYGARVDGVDISEEAIRIARKVSEINGVSQSCSFSVQNVQDLEFENEEFDIVVCNAVLHHILKYESVTEELLRVLSQDGTLLFGESLRRNPLYNGLRDLKRYFTEERVDGDVDLDMSDIEKLANNFEKSYYEFYSFVGAFKSALPGSYSHSIAKRVVLYVLDKIDGILIDTRIGKKYSNEIVGKLEVKK
ncbi:2-polyprenyl-3-methyl-5-hydroxy-6-metoxy-1,4-benzoquinol methylase [Salinibacter ruber]|uniref:class I SAM-dependent methyltransferase n=1 Tax=Salinibacter ruber TaxID=146919 RepID=UPI00216A4B79|nr:class I SAM-dependent methyltransferase [Salinibacter ruber]MCS3938734.1 2-polyprenyl-3-methyl-5-hydroxy-6-metoxy-1,4-benzoquinol methylase [Salinibacter ruber]